MAHTEVQESVGRKADADRFLVDVQHRLLTGTYTATAGMIYGITMRASCSPPA